VRRQVASRCRGAIEGVTASAQPTLTHNDASKANSKISWRSGQGIWMWHNVTLLCHPFIEKFADFIAARIIG
jgi:hypothetical protein